MPIVGVNRDRLFEALGRKYSEPRDRPQAAACTLLVQLECHCSTLLLTSCVSAIAADEEFDQLCFEYGIELDDVVSISFMLNCQCNCNVYSCTAAANLTA
eukprot:GHRQ01027623.1.p2 GENE.GHRQ01027623.1~~GHRQ01027623.1.p2  ORF type:complete len:100 (-),score=13.97 GHRQ01027623.1:75-374(-)